MNIVLHEPEIPHNTGAIGRTCSVCGAKLHLIRPFGFNIDEKSIRRAGMDYWEELDVKIYDDYAHFLEMNSNPKIYMATTKANKIYTEVDYDDDCFIMFGKESKGIPEEILITNKDNCIRIPMLADKRSINLSCSAAIIMYEALRQTGFCGQKTTGSLHRLGWHSNSV